MLKRCLALAIALVPLLTPAAFSQSLATGIGGTPGLINPLDNASNPAGLTLVPGTVVIPGVSGAAMTGAVPLPGISTPGNGGLYPPAYYPVVPGTGATQSTLPQSGPELSPPPLLIAPEPPSAVINCADIRNLRLCRR